MKTIGMLGGMSWESTLEYYRIINEEVKKRVGETHSAKCVMYSLHLLAQNIEKRISVPLLHIADAAAEEILK